MDPSENIPVSRFTWLPLYEAAVLETDNSVLGTRILALDKALAERLRELALERPPSNEWFAIQDALRALAVLKQERLHARRG